MRQTHTLTAFLTIALLAGSASAENRPDPARDLVHPVLKVQPRTAAETARIAPVLAPPADFTKPEPFEENPGGATTVRARSTADAFSQPSGNMAFEREMDFKLGNGLFKKLWVSSPSSTLASDGLGPVYNARSCQRCHLKDGRGHVPTGPDDSAVSMFLRLSVPAPDDSDMTEVETYLAALGDRDRTRPDPVLGGQLQDFAIPGHAAEGQMRITYTDRPVTLSDGTVITLQAPEYSVADAGYGALSPDLQLSPRIAPTMLGMGLLEAIPAADILANADPDDANGDGISGRAQVAWSLEHDRLMLGRFGWKAGNPSVRQQSASAFAGDIGISNPMFPYPAGDCTATQRDCMNASHGDGDDRGFELDAQGLDLVTFYSRNLGIPARRDVDDPQVLRGKAVFYQSGCASCHQPKFVTDRVPDHPEQSFQLIWPHSDLLLHDMGEGLADHRPEARATGREWRTAPLWGIGLTKQVSGVEAYLHDGRARTLLEAILWHDGEAATARQSVMDLPAPDRDALIRYLESL